MFVLWQDCKAAQYNWIDVPVRILEGIAEYLFAIFSG